MGNRMISQIDIMRYKGFKNTQIKFNDATLLLGANSGGKSSAIQALLLSDLAIETKQLKHNNIDITNNKYNLNLYGFDEILADGIREDDFEFLLRDDKDRNIRIKFLPTDDQNIVGVQVANATEKFFPEIIYLSAERSISSYQKMGNLDNLILGESNQYIGYIIEKGKKKLIYVDKERNYWENKETTFLDIQINEWLNYILPNNRVTAKDTGYDNHISLMFGDKGNLHQTNIGYGISFVLPIIVAGLIATKGSSIIVENPELHLHPQAQSKMAMFLATIAAAGVQVIIETHSEHIVNGFRKAVIDGKVNLKNTDVAINYFNFNNGCIVEEVKLNEAAEINYWPEGFMDQEQSDLFEMRKMRLLNERCPNNR